MFSSRNSDSENLRVLRDRNNVLARRLGIDPIEERAKKARENALHVIRTVTVFPTDKAADQVLAWLLEAGRELLDAEAAETDVKKQKAEQAQLEAELKGREPRPR